MKTIGIIGGMGPLATADLFQKIVRHTKASCDQEHIHILIDNNTSIPDRTAALLNGGEDPLPQMIRSALWLEKGGADCLIMPCNTAHNYHAAIQKAVAIPVLDMIALTCAALREKNIRCAGLLATSGTVKTGIYQKVAGQYGIKLLTPDDTEQAVIMSVIYQGVKAGRSDYDTAAFNTAVEAMFAAGAETMILGCTELPLAAEQYHMHFSAVDPTLELAKGAIRFVGGVVIP